MTQEIQTPAFILNEEKLKGSKNKKRYIKEINMLFRLMTKTNLSFVEGHLYFLLREKRERAYLQLLKEIFPLRYEIYLEEKSALLERNKSQ